MVLFVLAVLIALVAVGVLVVGARVAKQKVVPIAGGALGVLLAVGLVALGSFYTQDTGDASVVVSWDGTIVGQEITPGLHLKAPWDHVETFNVRNQQVIFAGGPGSSDNSGGQATGPEITVQDADGVTSDVDISLRYSITPSQVTHVYRQFRTEDNFKTSFIQQDVRAAVRQAPNAFSTIALLTKRGEVERAIGQQIEQRWANSGVSLDSISLQEIRPPSTIKDRYNAAVQSQIKVTQAKNELAAAQVQAQQQVVQAEARAKANDQLNRSLTGNVLKQRYLDTLAELAKSGNVVVVPEGFNGIVNVK